LTLLSDMLIEHAAEQADAEAVVFESTRLCYGEFNRRVNRLANGLGSLGLERGDHVALLMANCHQYLEAYYALSKAGMVCVPLNSRLSERELSYIVEHSESAALIADLEHAATTRTLRDEIDRLGCLIGVEAPGEDELIPYEEVIAAVTRIRGVGEWTAHMLLMFSLGRPDVLPVGDYGVRKAARDLYGLDSLPKPRELQSIANSWQPYRSVACWYLWRHADITAPD